VVRSAASPSLLRACGPWRRERRSGPRVLALLTIQRGALPVRCARCMSLQKDRRQDPRVTMAAQGLQTSRPMEVRRRRARRAAAGADRFAIGPG